MATKVVMVLSLVDIKCGVGARSLCAGFIGDGCDGRGGKLH